MGVEQGASCRQKKKNINCNEEESHFLMEEPPKKLSAFL